MKILIEICFLTQENNRTRGHEITSVKDQCRLDIRTYSFSQRTINEWSKLSTDCVTASSVKKSLHTFQEGGLHIDFKCLTLDKPMDSLSTSHLGQRLWL